MLSAFVAEWEGQRQQADGAAATAAAAGPARAAAGEPANSGRGKYVHWSEQPDLAQARAAFAARGRELRACRPSKTLDGKVVCIKCLLHALGLCVPCEGEKNVRIPRKYLRHASPDECLALFPTLDSLLEDEGKAEAARAAKAAKVAAAIAAAAQAKAEAAAAAATAATAAATGADTPAAAAATALAAPAAPASSAGPTSVAVTGLPYASTSADVRAHFADACGAIVAIRNKFGYEAEAKFKGLAFVEFANAPACAAALKLDGSEIGGRWIKVRVGAPRGKKKAMGSTRLMLSNLPYDPIPTDDEVFALLAPYGSVLSVKRATDGDRNDGKFRGFVFVIFHGGYDRTRVMEQLDNKVHWGRRIRVKPVEDAARSGGVDDTTSAGDAAAALKMRNAQSGFKPGLNRHLKRERQYDNGGDGRAGVESAPAVRAKKARPGHWSEHPDMELAASSWARAGRQLSKFKPTKKMDNKVVCVKCVIHGLGLCTACVLADTDTRKYLRHLSVDEARSLYPDLASALRDTEPADGETDSRASSAGGGGDGGSLAMLKAEWKRLKAAGADAAEVSRAKKRYKAAKKE